MWYEADLLFFIFSQKNDYKDTSVKVQEKANLH